MIISEFTTWCIILVGGTVLHSANITDINTAADAAKALEPLVQSFPKFWIDIQNYICHWHHRLGLLAVPVLSGSASYAVSEALNWNASLDMKFTKSKRILYGYYYFYPYWPLYEFYWYKPSKSSLFIPQFSMA